MFRKIIKINEELCNGCGECADACHEGAIAMVGGKAKLIRDEYCDGLGDCLPECPTGAIAFEEREAAAYDEQAVAENKKKMQDSYHSQIHSCPGSQMREIKRGQQVTQSKGSAEQASALCNWPVQIKLAPLEAPYFDGANLLIAADCTAYAYASMHTELIRGRVTLIGCPKLDAMDYSEKLTEIICKNDIQSVTVARMEVPCCGGLETAAKKAIQASGRPIRWQVITISIDGEILDINKCF